MTEVPAKPDESTPNDPSKVLKTGSNLGSFVAIFLVGLLVIGAGLLVWSLRPKQPPSGRPIGSAGLIQAFAVPGTPAGEGFTIWRDGRQVFTLPNDHAAQYERVELSSNDVDVGGSHAADLVLYTWTGGAHCCFTQILIDGQNGRLLGKLETGNADPLPFIPTTAKGQARAVVVTVDDVSAYKFGSYADSPMARIAIIWNGKRFALDTKRMKATAHDSPPAFFTAEPDLADSYALTVQDVGEDEASPADATQIRAKGGVRGDRATTYQTWMRGEEARMRATALVENDVTSFGPMTAFLNERIYKGQAVAGVATVMSAYEATPQVRDAALAYYFDVLKESRWLSDLDRLNGGQLVPLMTKLTSPLPTPVASP